MKPVGIIGGGISGLTLAWRLQEQGVPVRVYESGTRTGGAMQTHRHGEWLAEAGPNTILETSHGLIRMVQELGLDKQRRYAPETANTRYIVRGGEPVTVPTSVASMIATPLLSRSAKLRVLMEPLVRKNRGEEESLADFVRRRLGGEFLDYLINPLVAGIFAGDPEQLSVKHAFQRLWEIEQTYGSLIIGQLRSGSGSRSGSDNDEQQEAAQQAGRDPDLDGGGPEDRIPKNRARMFTFDKGLQALPERLHERLDASVHTRHTVRAVRHTGSEWQLEIERSDGKTERFTHSVVVYTAPAWATGQIDWQVSGCDSMPQLASIPHPPVCSVALGFRSEQVRHPLDGFGALVPEKEAQTVLGVQFNSSMFEGRAPEHHCLLTAYVGGMRRPGLAERSDTELIRLVTEDLDRLLGVIGQPVFTCIHRWPRAIPQYQVGHGAYLTLMQQMEERTPGFFLAGNYRTGISVGDCVHGAIEVSGRIAEYLQTKTSESTP